MSIECVIYNPKYKVGDKVKVRESLLDFTEAVLKATKEII